MINILGKISPRPPDDVNIAWALPCHSPSERHSQRLPFQTSQVDLNKKVHDQSRQRRHNAVVLYSAVRPGAGCVLLCCHPLLPRQCFPRALPGMGPVLASSFTASKDSCLASRSTRAARIKQSQGHVLSPTRSKPVGICLQVTSTAGKAGYPGFPDLPFAGRYFDRILSLMIFFDNCIGCLIPCTSHLILSGGCCEC